MSTTLKSVFGLLEIPNAKLSKSDYRQQEVHLTRFWGGDHRGVSLQLGFTNEEGNYCHIQLDNNNVIQLVKVLTEDFPINKSQELKQQSQQEDSDIKSYGLLTKALRESRSERFIEDWLPVLQTKYVITEHNFKYTIETQDS